MMGAMNLVVVLFGVSFYVVYGQYSADSSFDSLVASQCRARCLSLYPWQLLVAAASTPQYEALRYFQKRDSASISDAKISVRNVRPRLNRQNKNKNQRGHYKWSKVMEMCSKNTNCLQCTLPCDIPTNLLSNCKYLCKDNNQFCLDSCDLLTGLSQEKYGSCPTFINQPANKIQFLISAKGQLSESNTVLNQCSNQTESNAISALKRNNGEENNKIESNGNINKQGCEADSECGDIKKCCPLYKPCPKYGKVCAKPVIHNNDIASAPFNLTIIERKRGKTIILKWDCIYNKRNPTIFVVEGRWSLKSPQTTTIDENGRVSSTDIDSHMTKWGYLAQTVNNNWIILRNINRGRWYKFRVTAITKSGTLGYSTPTPLFILSSPPKPPSQPQNLTILNIYENSGEASINVDMSWLPSRRSDLPIVNYKLSWRQENSNNPHYGYDLIKDDGTNKYTIKNLMENTIYTVEVISMSNYENRQLKSKPKRVLIDTSRVIRPHSSYLMSESESEYEDEDENIEDNGEFETRNLRNDNEVINQIRNLTVKNPYFRNGLVKAKLSWSLPDSSSIHNINSASINSIILEQNMFKITWFPIKCESNLNKLPTPITATTINTNFEIYELKYGCDYVVNVRLESEKVSSKISSSLNPIPPQISSAQFKVPSCNEIEMIGQIRPRCYNKKTDFNNKEKLVDHIIKNPTISSHFEISTTKSNVIMTTKKTLEINQLPRVYNIRHHIVRRRAGFYSVKFTWSLPEYFREQMLFSGYQISVVPKAIPGFGLSDLSNDGLRSVGAIVEKEQNSFIVKQLRASVKYIFQIQLIALDNQSYGPASSLEFKIKPVSSEFINHIDTTRSNRFYSLKDRLNDWGGHKASTKPSFIHNSGSSNLIIYDLTSLITVLLGIQCYLFNLNFLIN